MTEKDFEALMQKISAYDSPDDAKIALNTIVSSLTQSLVKGEDITLEGLGTFRVVDDKIPMKGPTKIPGYSYPKQELLTVKQIKEDIHRHYYSMKRVKVAFDKTLEQQINKVKQ